MPPENVDETEHSAGTVAQRVSAKHTGKIPFYFYEETMFLVRQGMVSVY